MFAIRATYSGLMTLSDLDLRAARGVVVERERVVVVVIVTAAGVEVVRVWRRPLRRGAKEAIVVSLLGFQLR